MPEIWVKCQIPVRFKIGITFIFMFHRRPIQTIRFFPVGLVDLGSLGVTCSPQDPSFAGSNPAEVGGFFQDIKILSTSPPGGTLSWGS